METMIVGMGATRCGNMDALRNSVEATSLRKYFD